MLKKIFKKKPKICACSECEECLSRADELTKLKLAVDNEKSKALVRVAGGSGLDKLMDEVLLNLVSE